MSTNNYLSTLKPKFKPTVHSLGKIPAYQYKGSLKEELAAGTLTPAQDCRCVGRHVDDPRV